MFLDQKMVKIDFLGVEHPDRLSCNILSLESR
jgi:hypothetical protein